MKIEIREVLVKKDCLFCKGRENGCYDCGGKGYVKEWVSITELINDIKKCIERGKGIL